MRPSRRLLPAMLLVAAPLSLSPSFAADYPELTELRDRAWAAEAKPDYATDHAFAMVGLGLVLTQGIDRADLLKRVAKLYLKAAELNDPRATRLIAAAYAKGEGVEADARVAKKWYLKAVAAGDTDAKGELKAFIASEHIGRTN